MSETLRVVLRRAAVAAVLLALGSGIAAVNWHQTWRAFALDIGPTGSVNRMALEAQANSQQWMLTSLLATAVCAGALCWLTFRPEKQDRATATPVHAHHV